MKKKKLIFQPILISILLIFVIILPWVTKIGITDRQLSNLDVSLYTVNAVIWWFVLSWGLHHLSFQIAALFEKRELKTVKRSSSPRVALLYTTCDDFSRIAALSCLNQDYENYQLILCDDSREERYLDDIDKFVKEYEGKLKLIRRKNRKGFKAGNVNNALSFLESGTKWLLLIDADQILPDNYLSKIVAEIPKDYSKVAFIQGAQSGSGYPGSTIFQKTFSPEVQLFYSRDLNLRNKYGFVPLLGHGALIQRSVFEDLGGLPEIVSEDFAFALRASAAGWQGIFAGNVISYEAFPSDFNSFLIRLKKFSGGTAELTRKELGRFFSRKSKASLVEKWDFGFILAWYFMMPLIFLNSFLSAYVCGHLWRNNYILIHPVLPFLYSWMFLAVLSITVSVTKNLKTAFIYYCYTASLYSTAIPLASVRFIKHFFKKPSFERTPKNNESPSVSITGSLFMITIGGIAIGLSFYWWSPFSPVLFGQGLACLCFPIYYYFNRSTIWGSVSRFSMFLSGFFIFLGLITFWKWTGIFWLQ